MKPLNDVVARIALEVHPERIDAICSALGAKTEGNIFDVVRDAMGGSFSPRLTESFASALKANPEVSAEQLSAMFRASSATAALVAGTSSVELVWTGPATELVSIRHTAQVLTGLIDEARERLFLVSFVAYNVNSIVAALQRAIERGVQVSVLIEQSKEHGGTVTVDSIAMLKRNLTRAHIYQWDKTAGNTGSVASVHAKCAVADGTVAFVTSANLSEAAMERNMELGILVRGGTVPNQLDRHLHALITTRQLTSV